MKTVLSFVLLFAVLRRACGQCPDICACISLTSTVDCTPRPEITGVDFQFTSIPDGAPDTTRVLIMTGNAISSLPPGNLSAYPLLETLVLNDNLLTDVPTLNIPQLTNLTLDGNPFVSLRERAFNDLTSLQSLYIRRTTFSTLNASTFEGLTSLSNLYLDDNQLSALPSDFLSFIPQIQLLSLTNNLLQFLPDGFLSALSTTTALFNLVNNPWSCDCRLGWLRDFLVANTDTLVNDLETVCLWPLAHVNRPISSLAAGDFVCYAPEITQSPQTITLLSNVTLTATCLIDGAPFPEVTWTKDGEIVTTTSRVHLANVFSASLFFESLELSDSGDYECSVENANGSDFSSTGEIVILEHTCFDNLVSSHETDRDCGGLLCDPCNTTEYCLLDRDCYGELVCLFAHQLPSQLRYISSTNPQAFTCANSSLPPMLLEDILQTELPEDIFSVNVSGLQSELDLASSIRSLLAIQLDVTMETISNVRLSTVEKDSRPLVQIWFDLPKSRSGELARSRVKDLVNSGQLKATVRINSEGATHRIRMNI